MVRYRLKNLTRYTFVLFLETGHLECKIKPLLFIICHLFFFLQYPTFMYSWYPFFMSLHSPYPLRSTLESIRSDSFTVNSFITFLHFLNRHDCRPLSRKVRLPGGYVFLKTEPYTNHRSHLSSFRTNRPHHSFPHHYF